MGSRGDKVNDRRKKVSIFDDDVEFLEILEAQIQEIDHEVLRAINGISGHTMAWKTFFDVVITDITMPCRNGFEVINKIRGGCLNRSTPVVVISG